MKISVLLLRINFDRLTIFSFLWGVGTLYHIASFHENSLRNPFAWLTAVTASILLFKPSTPGLFATMHLFSIAKTINWMPYPSNQILFELILNIRILTAISYKFFRRLRKNVRNGKLHYHRDALFESLLTRMSLLLLYFIAVLHKLNADYLNPTISCGSVFIKSYSNEAKFTIG